MSNRDATRAVVVLGYGEVGRAFGVQIEEAGVTPTYVDPIAEGAKNGRRVLGAFPAELSSGTLVLGAVPSATALSVAQDLAARDDDFLYVDLSSSSLDMMRDCASAFEGKQARFVDGAIMGSVDLAGAASPILLSGPDADRAAKWLNEFGFSVDLLPASQAGDACGVKLLRSLMTKGIEALAIECLATASRMNLQDALRRNLSDIGARPFPDLLDAMVRSHVSHAPRRQYEVEAALGQARSVGLRAPVSEAVLNSFRRTAGRINAEHPATPMAVDQAVAWLSEDMQ